ncbi:LOW QUALITY PROTEIN: uncharacterized protein MYH16 [Dama dama]
MPGAYKGECGANVDQMPFLVPPDKGRIEAMNKPYDIKRSSGVKNEKGGLVAGENQSEQGDQVTMKTITNQTLIVKKENPSKFYQASDMADMTFLNEASVLDNLRQCYINMRIYTNSALLCVTVSPYRWLPIHGARVANMYKGKKHTEMSPHPFSIDSTYHDRLMGVGESGAGKTENTKKVVPYFGNIGGTSKQSSDGKGSLEEQVIQANPVLEAFRNAKTTRNNTSSSFGKFIWIHFGATGKLAEADIESYLLEKSRVISRQAAERSYHIFYQILSNRKPELVERLLLVPNPKECPWVRQGITVVGNMHDGEELQITDAAFDMLGFSTEKTDVYKLTGGITHFGNVKLRQKPRERQAKVDTTEGRLANKVAHLMGLNFRELQKGIIRLRVKGGNELVQKGQNVEQCQKSLGALGKAVYDKTFKGLVVRINKILDTKMQRRFFTGVLDIAGFKILEFSSFEQLCISFTKEKLQFFHHHMFTLEQKECKREGIQVFIDFGLDLQACIDLLEKGPRFSKEGLGESCHCPICCPEQWNKLMTTLHGTSPHFVCCIVPHEFKQSGVKDAHLIVHQLACNGILEGLRICGKGFPNRLQYPEFTQRYQALNPSVIPQGFVNKKASELLLGSINLDVNEYKIGHTKVFFRAGTARLEDMRDECPAKTMSMLQWRLRGFLVRVKFKKMLERRIGLKVIQRNTRKFPQLRFWGWWKLHNKIKPLLNMARQEEEMKVKEEELRSAMAKAQELLGKVAELEEKTATLSWEYDLTGQLQAEQENLLDVEECLTPMMKAKIGLESLISNTRERLEEQEGLSAPLSADKRKLEGKLSDLRRDLEGRETMQAKTEKEKQALDHKVCSLIGDLSLREASIAKLQKEKRALQELHQKILGDLVQAEEDKVNHLTKTNSKLTPQIHKLEDNWKQEKIIWAEEEKARRKAESDLQITTDHLHEMELSTSRRREMEINSVNSKHEDEQSLNSTSQQKLKELQGHRTLSAPCFLLLLTASRMGLSCRLSFPSYKADGHESRSWSKSWKLRGRMSQVQWVQAELRLNASGGPEAAALQSAAAASRLHRKHTDSVAELIEHVENLQRVMSKLEKDKQGMKAQINANVETTQKSKMNAEAHIKLEDNLAEADAKVAELERNQVEINANRSHLQAENGELTWEYEESQNWLNQILRIKTSLMLQVDDSKWLDEESEVGLGAHSAAVVSLANTKRDLDLLKKQLEEEQGGKSPAPQDVEKTVHELGDAEERAGTAETDLSKLRSRHHAADKGITSVEITQVPEMGSSKTLSEE